MRTWLIDSWCDSPITTNTMGSIPTILNLSLFSMVKTFQKVIKKGVTWTWGFTLFAVTLIEGSSVPFVELWDASSSPSESICVELNGLDPICKAHTFLNKALLLGVLIKAKPPQELRHGAVARHRSGQGWKKCASISVSKSSAFSIIII